MINEKITILTMITKNDILQLNKKLEATKMNKSTFEDWLNNKKLEDTIYFFAKDISSQTLTKTLIKEHGQEYFNTVLSNYINKNLEEITNINNLLTEVTFFGLENCLNFNENIFLIIFTNY